MALEISVGTVIEFEVSFEYRGPHYTNGFIRCSVGERGAIFNEKDANEYDLDMPKTPNWTTFPVKIEVPITDKYQAGKSYDLEVKLGGIPGSDLFWQLDEAVTFVGAEFRELTVTFKKA